MQVQYHHSMVTSHSSSVCSSGLQSAVGWWETFIKKTINIAKDVQQTEQLSNCSASHPEAHIVDFHKTVC